MNNNDDIVANNKTFAAGQKKFISRAALLSVLLFFGVLIFLGAVTFFSEKESFSENANKYLADFPKITWENYFDGTVTSGIEDYVADHFAWHDSWVRAKSTIELALGRREQNGVYILKNRIVKRVEEADETILQKNLDGIRSFSEALDAPVYLMLVPTSVEIYSDELPKNAPNLDQRAFMDRVKDDLGDSVEFLDVYSAMMSQRDNYIYYRTDHHWTTLGAYTAYSAVGRKMGYEPLDETAFDIEHTEGAFNGTFYSKVLYEGIGSDSIDLWHLPQSENDLTVEVYTSVDSEPEIYDSIYFRDYLSVKDKYSVFLGSNQPIVTINTGYIGGKLLIIKDSYANSYVPLLLSHYSEIMLIDLRYIQLPLDSVIDTEDYDSVLILYNVSGFSTDENLKKLGMAG